MIEIILEKWQNKHILQILVSSQSPMRTSRNYSWWAMLLRIEWFWLICFQHGGWVTTLYHSWTVLRNMFLKTVEARNRQCSHTISIHIFQYSPVWQFDRTFVSLVHHNRWTHQCKVEFGSCLCRYGYSNCSINSPCHTHHELCGWISCSP